MDNNTYEALNTKSYPDIIFKMNSLDAIKASSEGWQLTCTGKLSLAGKSRIMKLEANCTSEAGNIRCKGSTSFNMTDFGVDPPKALLGTIKTGIKLL